MPYGSRYRVPLRRRREKKTDYQARKGFVVSGKPRLVARSSLKNTTAQIITAKPQGDIVLASAHSHELTKNYGWKGATGNVPAAYLTGLLCGLKAKKAGVTEAILDLGLVSPTKGSKVFSTMAGVVDAGVSIPHSDEKIVLDRNQGFHIVDYAETFGSPEELGQKFSTLVKAGVQPKQFNEQFNKVKVDIMTAYGLTWKPEPRQAKPKKAEQKKPEAKPAPKPEAKKAEPKAPVEAPKPEAPKPKTPEAEVTVPKPEKAEVVVEAKPAAARAKPVEAKVEEAPKAEPKHKAPKAKTEPEEEKPEVKPKAGRKPKAAKTEVKPKAEKKAKSAKAEESEEKPAKPAKAKKAGGKKA